MDPVTPTALRHARRRACGLRSEAGSTTLEFAIALPVVLMLVIGTMVVMIGLFEYANAMYATSIAARYASLHSSTSDTPATSQSIASQVQSHLWMGASTAQIATTWTAGNVVGSSVSIATTLTLPLGLPFTNINQLTMSATSGRTISH